MMGPDDYDNFDGGSGPISPDMGAENPAGPLETTLQDPQVAAWMGLSYSTLSALMVHTRYVAAVHQQHHWICKGDPFYGDHLLFEKLYDKTAVDIDNIAEKLVGLASDRNLDLSVQMKMLSMLVDERYGMQATIPSAGSLAIKSLDVEETFLHAIAAAMDQLECQGELTVGLENFLAQLADDHEKHVYFLKQRTTT